MIGGGEIPRVWDLRETPIGIVAPPILVGGNYGGGGPPPATMVYRAPVVANNLGNAITTSSYLSIGGICSQSTTLAFCETPIRTAGTFKNFRLFIYANGSTTDTTVRVIVNGVATSASITIPSLATGLYEDSVDPVTVAVNDMICFEIIRGSAESIRITSYTLDYMTTEGKMLHISSASAGGVNNTGGGASRFMRLNGSLTLVVTEAEVENYVPCAMTVTSFSVYVSDNTRTTNSTVRIRKNGANSATSITIPFGVTGWFTTSTTESFAAGDRICLNVLNGGSSGNFVMRQVVTEVTPTVNGTIAMFSGAALINMTAANSPRNTVLAGQQMEASASATPSTDGRYKLAMRGAGVVQNLYCQAQNNACDVDTIYSIRSNNSGVGISATLPALTNGMFSDTTNTYSFTSSDNMDINVARAGLGAHFVGSASFQLTATQEAL